MKIYYNKKLKTLSRVLRKNSTLSEVLLWNQLKGKKLKGYRFMRQKPIGDYIVDFYCSKLKLVIEIDGITHNDKLDLDKIRQEKLESLGLNVIRFNDIDIKKNLAGVLENIEMWIEKCENKQPPESPFAKGE